MDPWIHGSADGAAARSAAGAAAGAAASVAVCVYCILGALTLEHRAKRWLGSCGFDRGTRTGKLEQPNARRER